MQTFNGDREVSSAFCLLAGPEVLRHVPVLADASNGDSTAALVVAIGAVKRHDYNLCCKLGAQNRMQAVVCALHLL